MTENKRFKAHIFDDGVNERYHDGIIDNENDENVIRNYQYISRLLNELHDENEQLKDALNQRTDQCDKYYKENEQLKQYIYDNLDEDICDVCSYQYLEKSQMDKYYVAKCKKGYDNCSKGTVIHCKDFKFKELQE